MQSIHRAVRSPGTFRIRLEGCPCHEFEKIPRGAALAHIVRFALPTRAYLSKILLAFFVTLPNSLKKRTQGTGLGHGLRNGSLKLPQ